ncbi:MAG: nitrous oxide-stimulated promoter family protein [Promethearchaeota archaeon]
MDKRWSIIIKENRRIKREKKTIGIMINSYCNAHHNTKENLCNECQELLDYALKRVDRCPFSENKPTCEKCLVHCYIPEMREKIRVVMRYAGPRMIWSHPILAILHLFDRF